MPKLYLRLVVVLIMLLCTTGAMAQSQLNIPGTGDGQQLLRQLARAFEAANPGTRILIPDSVGSSGGVKALLKGKSEMARVARPLKDKEKALAEDLVYREYAYSPVVFAANQTEPCIESLSTDQVIGIFSGTISDWSELGSCQPNEIYVAMREAGDSSRSVLGKKVPGFKAIPEFAGQEIFSTPETIQTIAEYPGTIGFLPQGFDNPRIRTFSFNGVSPAATNVKDGSYPLATPFALVWRGELPELGARFLNFIYSPEGEKILLAAGVVSVSAQ